MQTSIWDTGYWKNLPTLAGEVSADACVIGLGGSGLAAVEELASLGMSVVGIDAGSVGGGAAGRNGGFLLAGMADFFDQSVARLGRSTAQSLYRCTLEEIARLSLEFPTLVKNTGSLRIAANDAEKNDCRQHLAALKECNFEGEAYSGPEGEGVLIPGDAAYQPRLCVQAQASHLCSLGISLFENSRVTGIAQGRVTTPSGSVRCGTVIAAVDGGLERIFPELRPRVRTARLQMLATGPAPEVSFPRPIYWRDGYEYWQQLRGGEIALGGFRDAGGEAEWTSEGGCSEIVQEKLEQFLRGNLRVTAPITHRWSASVAYTADRLPILEEVRHRVLAVGGYSGTGNIVGRLCGRAAARMACGVPSGWADLLTTARTRSALSGSKVPLSTTVS